jgi:hypothetical protein
MPIRRVQEESCEDGGVKGAEKECGGQLIVLVMDRGGYCTYSLGVFEVIGRALDLQLEAIKSIMILEDPIESTVVLELNMVRCNHWSKEFIPCQNPQPEKADKERYKLSMWKINNLLLHTRTQLHNLAKSITMRRHVKFAEGVSYHAPLENA